MNYNDKWHHQLRPDELIRQVKMEDNSRKAATLALISALLIFSITTIVPRRYRVVFMLTSGLVASIATSKKKDILSLDRRQWSSEVIEEEAYQDNLYQQLLIPEEVEVKPVKYQPKLYDINDLKVTRNSSQFRHRMVLAVTGDGKTTLMRHLAKVMHEVDEPVHTTVLTPSYQLGDFEESAVYGKGGSVVDLEKGVTSIQREYVERQELYMYHQYKNVYHTFIDEYRVLQQKSAQLRVNAMDWATQMRKYFMCLWLFVHLDNVKTLGFEGEGDLRQNFLIIRLGTVAVEYAKELVKLGLQPQEFADYVQSMKRPCLVDDQPMLIPEIEQTKAVEITEETETEETVDEYTETRQEDIELYDDFVSRSKVCTRSQALNLIRNEQGLSYQKMKAKLLYLEGLFGDITFAGKAAKSNGRSSKEAQTEDTET